ncbi:MAG: hypothetical protein ACRD1H_16830 [Vicinamibacterales bacterium]
MGTESQILRSVQVVDAHWPVSGWTARLPRGEGVSGETMTIARRLASLAGGAGVVLMLPVAILIIGIPIALAARGLAEAIGWLAASVLK